MFQCITNRQPVIVTRNKVNYDVGEPTTFAIIKIATVVKAYGVTSPH